ncbi:M3 family oligoendopeptidase [Peptostreptococcus sp. D1]|uniref:M3 family oligoendopeptidase n=1 Tax=Peptostreptococcus sp. D1 TaxID=72304 RepID=UPI0008E80142|nr:M3 family oligoendopeptidase [Peptostreptococcus sp. D1]SFE63316.1 oligoendopeptidase, M3 family [Peptostreptococcus sp. D1]
MKFSDIKYERVSYEDVNFQFLGLIEKIRQSDDFTEILKFINELNRIRNHVETMKEYASIRYSIDTTDELFCEENNYWDEYDPYFKKLDNIFYKALLEKNIEKELVAEFGKQFYSIIELKAKSFSESIVDLLQIENLLMSEYTKLLSSAKIEFDGRVCNLSDLAPYIGSSDREVRVRAIKLHTEFFEKNEESFDLIFDKLVKIRHEMANKLGYDNFIELGYMRMLRTDYSTKNIEGLRKFVTEKYVPLANEIYLEQAKRINSEKFDYYDEGVHFSDGNAKLIGDGKYIISMGAKMYSELSPEASEFYTYLVNNELFDVKPRPNKAMGGYCTLLPEFKDPFIFGNFNGTVDDIDVLTHEVGHALQMYLSRDIDMPEIAFPTLDSCEIHSMSMEFFTYPWMNLFFGEDEEKYKKYHYDSALKFIPYGTLVDHFQHIIYENPSLSPSERKSIWRELEKKYLPHRDYSDLAFLKNGGYWYRQGHIFKDPFYYIDYVLAQLCALQFYELSKLDYDNAWKKYINICKVGGKYSFLDIVKIAGLENPLNYENNFK